VAWAVDTRPRADAVDRWPAAACWILGLCIGAFLKTPVTITLGDALLECHRNSGPTAAGDNEYALEQKYSLSFSVSRLCRSRATYQKDPQPGEHRQRDAIQRGGELTPCTTCMSPPKQVSFADPAIVCAVPAHLLRPGGSVGTGMASL
jgi:hypothetical protein